MCTDPVPQFIHCVLTVLWTFLQQVASHKQRFNRSMSLFKEILLQVVACPLQDNVFAVWGLRTSTGPRTY